MTILCIEDKTKSHFLQRAVNETTRDFEMMNLKRHLEKAKVSPKLYRYLDIETACIKEIEVEL